MRIISYNVNGIRSALNKGFCDWLATNPADVICLQEYYRKDKPTRFETLDSLYSIIGSENYHERSAYKKVGNQNFGIAMFSKYPMIAKGDVIFESQSLTDCNYCIYSDIVKNQDTFRIYNVHLQSIRLNERPYKFNKTKISDKKNENVTGSILIWAIIILIPLVSFIEKPWETTPSIESGISVVYLGLVSTGLAWLLRFRILKNNGLIFQSQVSYLIPIFGIILSYIFLKICNFAFSKHLKTKFQNYFLFCPQETRDRLRILQRRKYELLSQVSLIQIGIVALRCG